jgi:glycerol-3-phosphate dehydrogenase (NAD(P)+)
MTVAASDATFANDLAQRLSGHELPRLHVDRHDRRGNGAARSRTCSRIGAGISDGLGFGANTRIALITRGWWK